MKARKNVGTDPIQLVLQPVSRGLVQATVANTRAGTVMACRRARLSPAIGGRIARLPVKEGNRVRSGQLLLEMWNEDRKSEVELAQREALAAEARTEESCTMAQTAQREAKRLSTLYKQGLASEEATDRALGDAKARRAACQGARATAKVASARVDVAQALLEKTRLLAPFDGTVAEINGELGEFVTPSPVEIPTPPAVDLVDGSCLYIVAPSTKWMRLRYVPACRHVSPWMHLPNNNSWAKYNMSPLMSWICKNRPARWTSKSHSTHPPKLAICCPVTVPMLK